MLNTTIFTQFFLKKTIYTIKNKGYGTKMVDEKGRLKKQVRQGKARRQ